MRPIVSKSGSAAGELAALTGSPVECTGMWKDAQASPSPQARDANNAFQDTPAASAFKTVGVERISWKARLGGPLFVSYLAGGERSCQKRIFLPLQLCVHSAMN